MKNKKAFTLIEILGVIVILSIVLGLAVVGYVSIRNNIKKTYYKALEESVKQATSEYYAYNKEEQPNIYGNQEEVMASVLVNKEYIDKIVDQKGNSCDLDRSVGIAYKNSYDKTIYNACLICDDYETNTSLCRGEVDYTLKTIATLGTTSNDYKEGTYVNQDVKLLFKTQNDINRVEVKKEDGTIYKTCNLTNNSCNVLVEESNNYVIKGYGENGKATPETTINILIDKEKPTFEIADIDNNIISNTTIEKNSKSSVEIKNYIINLNDNLSGIKYIRYSFEERDEKEIYNYLNSPNEISKNLSFGTWDLIVEVRDNAGNIQKKTVQYEIKEQKEVITPTITFSRNNKWITATCTSSDGIASFTVGGNTIDVSDIPTSAEGSKSLGNCPGANNGVRNKSISATCVSTSGGTITLSSPSYSCLKSSVCGRCTTTTSVGSCTCSAAGQGSSGGSTYSCSSGTCSRLCQSKGFNGSATGSCYSNTETDCPYCWH